MRSHKPVRITPACTKKKRVTVLNTHTCTHTHKACSEQLCTHKHMHTQTSSDHTHIYTHKKSKVLSTCTRTRARTQKPVRITPAYTENKTSKRLKHISMYTHKTSSDQSCAHAHTHTQTFSDHTGPTRKKKESNDVIVHIFCKISARTLECREEYRKTKVTPCHASQPSPYF